MKAAVLFFFLFINGLVGQASAQGIWGQFFCNGNISDHVRGAVSYTAQFSVGYLDLEISNNTSEYRITSVSLIFEGSYNGRSFTRRYDEQEVEIMPGTSARLVFLTDIPGSYRDNTNVDDIRLVEVFGCND